MNGNKRKDSSVETRSLSQTKRSNFCCKIVQATCSVCGKTESLRCCSKCKVVFYCSREHQKCDWKNHKKVCQSDNQIEKKLDHTRKIEEMENSWKEEKKYLLSIIAKEKAERENELSRCKEKASVDNFKLLKIEEQLEKERIDFRKEISKRKKKENKEVQQYKHLISMLEKEKKSLSDNINHINVKHERKTQKLVSEINGIRSINNNKGLEKEKELTVIINSLKKTSADDLQRILDIEKKNRELKEELRYNMYALSTVEEDAHRMEEDLVRSEEGLKTFESRYMYALSTVKEDAYRITVEEDAYRMEESFARRSEKKSLCRKTFDSKNSSLKRKISVVNEKHNSLAKKYNSLEKKYNEDNDEKEKIIDELRGDISILKSKNNKMLEANPDLMIIEKHNSLVKEYNSLAKKYNNLGNDIDEQEEIINGKEEIIDELRDNISILKRKNKKMLEEKESYETVHASQSVLIKEKHNSLLRLVKKYNSLVKEYNSLAKRYYNRDDVIDEKEEIINKKEEIIDELRGNVSILKRKNKKMLEEKKSYEIFYASQSKQIKSYFQNLQKAGLKERKELKVVIAGLVEKVSVLEKENIQMSVSNEFINSKNTVELNEKLKEVGVKLKKVKKVKKELQNRKNSILERILEQATSKNECKICFYQKINVVFNCGHTTCEECSKKIEKCHVCRSYILEKKKIFL